MYEWFNAYASRQFAQLSVGRLWADLLDRFDTRLNGRDPLKLGLYACHDTTLAGMLKVLDIYDDRWPAFTAYISVELFREQQGHTNKQGGWLAGLGLSNSLKAFGGPQNAYVRLRYNSKDVMIPACKAPGSHLEGSGGSICTRE